MSLLSMTRSYFTTGSLVLVVVVVVTGVAAVEYSALCLYLFKHRRHLKADPEHRRKRREA